ncbi:hypothetical protein RclHR1_01300010 [Rhizophagus clarus]|uniref:Uncharacterized protein n=1 Tax=Rhizophagus clarus TaxID=94130 RepID=A0A2Z6QAQ0_9GLOM|nr:hypothetical protein RclHR1_01300010 [Rhizophagus clarus]GES95691.1 hypothetical protein GLOIN_2v1471047 [Rhizophagus clarus]
MDNNSLFYDQQSSTINYSQLGSAYPDNQQQKNLRICYLKFYHHSSNNFYLVNCKIVSQEDSSFDNNNHDFHSHEFFYQHPSDPSTRYHVTCRLLSNFLVENVLNDEICEMDFDVRVLSINQKLYLEQSLKQKLYCRMHYNKGTYSIQDDVRNHVIVTPISDIQNYSDNDLSDNNHIINRSDSTYIQPHQPQQQVDFTNLINLI